MNIEGPILFILIVGGLMCLAFAFSQFTKVRLRGLVEDLYYEGSPTKPRAKISGEIFAIYIWDAGKLEVGDEVEFDASTVSFWTLIGIKVAGGRFARNFTWL